MPALNRLLEKMEQKEHKKRRLENYDYGSNGAYFITVCTYERAELFGSVGEPSEVADKMKEIFEEVLSTYSQISCPQYVVMPNHLHALLVIDKTGWESREAIPDFMRVFKSKSTVAYIRMVEEGIAQPFHGKLWQRSYYDHIIRNEQDFREVWKYIEENPLRWKLKRQKDL